MLLANFEFDWWFYFFKNKYYQRKKERKKGGKTGFPLKPDDFIVMSSNVHKWKGKPRSIV